MQLLPQDSVGCSNAINRPFCYRPVAIKTATVAVVHHRMHSLEKTLIFIIFCHIILVFTQLKPENERFTAFHFNNAIFGS